MSIIDEIAFYATPPSKGPIDGFSYAGLKIVKELNALGIKTPWRDDSSPVSISFCQPPYSQSPNQFRVGYTPWESTTLPDWWIDQMNEVDYLWTTSSWCKEVFIKNGITQDILVVPHGVDGYEWTLGKRVKNRKFTFLHMGEPATRKNGQMVLDAFIEVFGDNKDVNLIFKANGSADVRLREPFGPVTMHPRIMLITENYSVPELNALYHQAHCMVYPSSGEGFGMIPLQSMATGMPTLLVNYGGVKEFGDHGIEIDYKVSDSAHNYHTGEWAFPSFESLCDKMWEVYEYYEEFSETAWKNALQLRQRFSWPDIVKTAIDDLELRIKF